MSHDHDHPHSHEPGQEHHHGDEPVTPEPQLPEDSNSQALEEALRSSFVIVKVAMVLMVVVFLGSGFFTVGASEKAVILRFGKPVGEGQKALLSAGLHWSYPYPIDEVVKIPINENQNVTSLVGWYFTTPEQELSGEELPAGQSLNPAMDGYVITADHNIIHVRATLYYHIDDPLQYVFEFSNAAQIVENTLTTALVQTAARYNVDDILQRDQTGFKEAVGLRVAELAEKEKLGISIGPCDIKPIPPRQLDSVFSAVSTARENRDKLLIDAQSQRNKVLSEAGAQAVTITNLAAADRDNYVKSLKAEAKRFTDLLPQYTNHPNLFAQQQLVAAMEMALTNVQDVHFQTGDGKPSELRLMLNREPPQPKQATVNP